MRLCFVSSFVVLLLLVSSQLVIGDDSDDSSSVDNLAYPSRPPSPPNSASSDESVPPNVDTPSQDDPPNDSSSQEPAPESPVDSLPPTTSIPDPVNSTPAPATPELSSPPTPEPLPPTPAPLPPAPALPTVPKGPVTFSMKLLLVGTSATDTYYLSAKLTLDSVGAPYDTVFVGSIPELSSANGVGKYGGIIVAVSSGLDAALSEALTSYQIAYGVRKVDLYTTPAAPAMQLLGSASAQEVSFKIRDASYTKGVQLSFADSIPYGYTAEVLDAIAATPVILGKLADTTETVIAAIIQASDGTNNLEFYIPPTLGEGYSLAFGNIWLQWVSGGAFVGLRRIIWSIQVDDLFLSTTLFDPVTATQSGGTYRCTPEDIANLETVIALVNEYVPGSNIRVEFAFNGEGVQLGGGVTADPLYLELKQRQNSFFFESHTFTHPSLDTYTYDQTIAELLPNIDIARDFFGTTNSTPIYSSTSMVTPSISGLFNGEVLRALAAVGITSVVGDNSRPELVPENKYHGIYTTVATHGFDGIFIVPRQVSDIYYDVCTPEAEVAQYDQLYSTTKTVHEIVIAQAQTAALLLLSYRHDPFMFHQANLGSYSLTMGGKLKVTSLLNMWIANTFSQLARFSTLPYWTFKHEELAEIWKQREVRDNCEVDVQALVTDSKITSLNLVSAKTCRYALTGINAQPIAGVTSTEVYGPDITTWIDLSAGVPVQLTLVTPVSL